MIMRFVPRPDADGAYIVYDQMLEVVAMRAKDRNEAYDWIDENYPKNWAFGHWEEFFKELEELANEMYLRGADYIGPAQERSWRDVPTSSWQNMNMQTAEEAGYWYRIGRLLLSRAEEGRAP